MDAATDNTAFVVVAPERIVSETRADFRRCALDGLGRASAGGAATLVVDLHQTVELDASGLGILVLVQKRAKERGLATRLANAPDKVRNLLKLTKLDFLFELTK